MLLKTHLVVTLCGILIFLSAVEHKITFVIVALVATIIPDIDTSSSRIGSKLILRPFQLFVKHRGLVHSFTFLFLVTLFFVLFIPVLAFGFFLGYVLHLFADSFTQEGIQVFYPFRKRTSWRVRTGGKTEVSIFIIFILIDLFLFVLNFSSFF